MKTLSLLLSAMVLLPCIATPAAAQRELKIRALSFQPGFPSEIHAHLPSGSVTAGPLQVKSFLNHEGNLLKFAGERLVFTVKSAPSSATDVNQQLASVDIPGNLKSAILIFVSEAPNATDFHSRVIVIDDSSEAFPPGSFKVANVGSLPVKIELEKQTYTCEPGEMTVLTKVRFGPNQAAGMRAYCKRGDEWKLITSGVWSNPGTRRVLEVFTEDLQTKEIKLRGIRDVVSH